jgi:hypothetical protein
MRFGLLFVFGVEIRLHRNETEYNRITFTPTSSSIALGRVPTLDDGVDNDDDDDDDDDGAVAVAIAVVSASGDDDTCTA